MVITERNKGIIPALDVPKLDDALFMIDHTQGFDGIVAYKVGKMLALLYGLPRVIKRLKSATDKPLIYDDQKSPADIPAQAREFVDICSMSNVDYIIGFPHSGPASMLAFLEQCKDNAIEPIIGLHMTHDQFLNGEGGWISDSGPKRAFQIAMDNGVTNFVVPGTKPESVAEYYKFLSAQVPVNKLMLMAPGFVAQGGSITKCGEVAGPHWCAIVGSAFTKHLGDWRTMRKVAQEMVSQID
jgi:orotidine-5'-phosphate decarboxylase